GRVAAAGWGSLHAHCRVRDPHPYPSPQGGGEPRRTIRACTSSSPEHPHQLDMRRKGKLVDRRYGFEAIAAIDEEARIAREGFGLTRDGNDHRHFRAGDLLG